MCVCVCVPFAESVAYLHAHAQATQLFAPLHMLCLGGGLRIGVRVMVMIRGIVRVMVRVSPHAVPWWRSAHSYGLWLGWGDGVHMLCLGGR